MERMNIPETTHCTTQCSLTSKEVQIFAKSSNGRQPKRPKPPLCDQPSKMKQIKKRREKNKQARKSRRK